MQAIILATRELAKLQPLTSRLPAPLLPIANRPVMSYALELLARHGVKQIWVSLPYPASAIESYFGGGRRWGVSLHYGLQRDPAGSAGSLRLARHWLTGSFIVLPGDVLLDLNLSVAMASHRSRRSLATVITQPSITSGPPTAAPPGLYLFEPEVIEQIPETPSGIQTHLLPALLSAGMLIHRQEMKGLYNSLETWQAYLAAQHTILGYSQQGSRGARVQPLFAIAGNQVQSGVWVGRKSTIHPDVQFIPPVVIGERCRIARGVELGPNAMIGNHVVVDEDASISTSVVLDHTYVGQLVQLDHKVVDGKLVVDAGSEAHIEVSDRFLLDETGRSMFRPMSRMKEARPPGTRL
jgi:mannose-1-phosphate guanylyltransferase/phosphomannomutase